MPGKIVGAVAGPVLGKVFGAKAASDGAAKAAAIQTEFARESREIAEKYANQGYTRTNKLVQRDLNKQRELIRSGFQGENAIIDQTYGDALGYFDPYIEDGLSAQDALAFENGIGERPRGYQGFKGSGGYQFRLREAQKAIEASAAARGGLYSGATGQRLMDRTQDYASQEFDQYYNRLSEMAGRGQAASSAASGLTTAIGGQRLTSLGARTAGLSGASSNALATRVNATTARNNTIIGAATQANETAGNAQAQAKLVKGQAKADLFNTGADLFTNALGFFAGKTA